MKAAVPPTVKIAELEQRIERLEAVLSDIAQGRWNTGNRVLDTPDRLTAREYARAGLKDRS